MNSILKTEASACRACQTCMFACALAHGEFSSLHMSRIRVVHCLGERGSADLKICRHCVEPKCVLECPTGAIEQGHTGLVRIDSAKCIGCGRCANNCPFQAIVVLKNEKKSIKCDLCENRKGAHGPACVEVCPVGAVKLAD